MKLPSKPMIALISIPVLILLFFSSNIYGYFRFKHYCSAEGGLRVYEKLERNVGWLAKDKGDAKVAAQLAGIGFVRYRDKNDGKHYDLRYLRGDPQRDSSYEILLSDKLKPVIYQWRNFTESVSNEIRLNRFGESVLGAEDGKLLAYYNGFSYSAFNINHTIFGSPSNQYCFLGINKERNKIDEWINELNKAFKD